MGDLERKLTELAAQGRDEIHPVIDVREAVRASVEQIEVQPLDLLPFAFSGAGLTAAAAVLFFVAPEMRVLLDPWVCYFLF